MVSTSSPPTVTQAQSFCMPAECGVVPLGGSLGRSIVPRTTRQSEMRRRRGYLLVPKRMAGATASPIPVMKPGRPAERTH